MDLEYVISKASDLSQSKNHLVVAISGFGGSGKTTIAQKVKNSFIDSTWVQLDNFLINQGQGKGWAGGYDWQRFESVLQDIKAGRDLHYQWYDWQKDALSEGWIDEKLPKVIVVEGCRIIQPDLVGYYDLSVWIDVDLETATARGKVRDKKNWALKDNKSGLEAHIQIWDDVWAPKDKEYFAKFNPNNLADIIISNE